MAGRGRPKKSKFDDLDQDFKDAAEKLEEPAIRDLIAKTALNLAALLEAQEADQDLQQKKEAAKEANAVYKEGKKFSKLSIGYLRALLDAKGKETGTFEVE
jgi:hypothetical protein